MRPDYKNHYPITAMPLSGWPMYMEHLYIVRNPEVDIDCIYVEDKAAGTRYKLPSANVYYLEDCDQIITETSIVAYGMLYGDIHIDLNDECLPLPCVDGTFDHDAIEDNDARYIRWAVIYYLCVDFEMLDPAKCLL